MSQPNVQDAEERRALKALFYINASMFILEMCIGLLSDSTALVADSLDMFADATVYSISLYAVGKGVNTKKRAAFTSGLFQIVLGVAVLFDIVRRLLGVSHPDPLSMVAVGLGALVANSLSLYLIHKYREGEVHMRASWIFSRNDVIANLGVIVAGALVYTFESRYPDLIIGLIISLIVVKGGLGIITDSRK